MRILILSVPGEYKSEGAESAVKEYIENNIPGWTVIIIDVREYICPLINSLVSTGFLTAARNSPVVYDKLYNRCDNEFPCDINKMFNDMLSEKLEDLISEIRPDIIMSTHTFYLKMLSELKKSGKAHIPVIALITDYTISKYWIYDFLEAYVIPQENLKGELVREGINERRIFSLGIPVSSKYLYTVDRSSVLKGLGFSDKKTLLIMSSSLDEGQVKKIFKTLALSDMDIQIIAVAGSNSKLKNRLESIARDCHKRIKVFGYTDKVSELMSACDILITKPLGHILAKAMIKGIPAAIMPPVPGKETIISDYLVKNGAAVCLEKSSIETTLSCLLNNDEKLLSLKTNSIILSKPDAAASIASLAADMVKIQ